MTCVPPLASAKAAVGTLRMSDLPLTEEDRAELLATAEESLDRLSGLVENLLDMSRLQAGASRSPSSRLMSQMSSPQP